MLMMWNIWGILPKTRRVMQYPTSKKSKFLNLEVAEGTEMIIKANDVFGEPFTFYINGQSVTPDENGYVHVTVDAYQFVLVGALSIPVIAPDGYESLNWFQRIIQSIKDFFAKITSWFKK
jgi:hypothetical protein